MMTKRMKITNTAPSFSMRNIFCYYPAVFPPRRMAPKLDAIGPCTSSGSDSDDSFEKVPSVLYDPVRNSNYTIDNLIGKGGFAKCYSAVDSAYNEAVALKVISKSRLTKQSHLEKMRKEIAIHDSLRHPNIVKLLNFFEDSTHVYMVLEFCSNNTLLQHIQYSQDGYLSESSARGYLDQIVDAVCYLHESVGVLHRDLKPGNVLLNCERQVKLADFGLAIRISEMSMSSLSVCGTPNYISPQVLNREGHSKESEAWSIGCILYCMVVGKPPFETDTLERTYERICACDYSFPTNIHISRRTRDLISRLLHPLADKRLKVGQIRSHPFFVEEKSRSHLRVSSIERLSRCRDRLPSDYFDRNQGYTTTFGAHMRNGVQPGIHSGDSGFGSDGFYVARMQNGAIDPLGLYNEVMSGCYVVSDAAACSTEGHLLMISKWVDYTNKFGFGCVLSDNTHCILFSDKSALSLRRGISSHRYCFVKDVSRDICNRIEWTNIDMITDPTVHKRLNIAKLFCDYMERELQTAVATSASAQQKNIRLLVSYKRRSNALLMVLSDGTAQINFIDTHCKLVISRDEYGNVMLSVVEPNYYARMYRMVARNEYPNRPESRHVQQLLNNARNALEGSSARPYYATEC